MRFEGIYFSCSYCRRYWNQTNVSNCDINSNSNPVQGRDRTGLSVHTKFEIKFYNSLCCPPRPNSPYQTLSKSTLLAVEYSHEAVTMVLKMRSLASGSVRYSSWMKSVKADCVVFSTRKSRSPPTILGRSVSEQIATLWSWKVF